MGVPYQAARPFGADRQNLSTDERKGIECGSLFQGIGKFVKCLALGSKDNQ